MLADEQLRTPARFQRLPAITLHVTGQCFDLPARLGRTPAPASRSIRSEPWTPERRPAWSPLSPLMTLEGPAGLLFTPMFWNGLAQRAPSLTRMRRLNEAIARRKQIAKTNGDADWLPWPVAAEHFVDLFALACSRGPLAVIDLADLLWQDAKLASIIDDLDFDTIGDSFMAAIIALSPTGLIGGMSPGVVFLEMEAADDDSIARAQFEWWTLDDCQEILEGEARAAISRSPPSLADAARRFLDPAFDDEPPAPAVESHPARAEVDSPADHAEVLAKAQAERSAFADRKSARQANLWSPPEMPAGVELTDRALRELRKERRFAESRFADALLVLADYRMMRLGRLSPSEFALRAQERRFADSACFAGGSSGVYASDYQVRHRGKVHDLDRHLKWGKANNAIAALRVYYAWDEERRVVVIGSAPRHLPIWMS